MKKQKWIRKGLAMLLTAAMVVGLIPAMSGEAVEVQAATENGTGSTLSVTAYATKEQMMDGTFAPDSDGTATNIGKLVFGKKSDGTTAQEWYILGKDTGVSGDNTIIFAASPIATNQVFENDYSNNKAFQSSFGVYASNPSEVYPNHYGASDLRVALQSMAANTDYFTVAEQGLMNATTVKTEDMKNKDGSGNTLTYTTTDKLYALQGDYDTHDVLWAGSSDSTVLAVNSYWSSGDLFWLRSPIDNGTNALYAYPHDRVYDRRVEADYNAVQPASNLNLSSVLFASAATAASSETAESGTIADGKAMILRLDGTGKNVGTVTYNTTTGDIKVAKGSTSQTVALIVQGNDGTKDWYYSKKITGTEVVNVTDIVSETNTPASINLSTCKIWLETTDSTNNLTYAVEATETTIIIIHSVAITGIDTPVSNTALDNEAACATTGVSSTTPQITWTPNDSTAGYNTSYTASVTLTAATGYEFINSTTATVLGNTATSVTKNADGTLTVTYIFSATKDKLTSITAPQAITAANGTAYSAMNLPEQVNIVTEGNTVTSAPVTWNTTTPASGSYDPAVLTEQTVTLNGAVTCPDSIDTNGITPTTTITITISAADTVKAPTANPTAGTYTENQSVILTSDTEGATIYYTTDGSEPTLTGSAPSGTTKAYTTPISVTGIEGQSVQTTIKAIAVKSGMQDSGVETFSYTIQITTPQPPTITISAAGIVGAPTANPTAGTYTENQSVALTSSTEGATIYYTTDGSEPALSGGVPSGTTQQYTAPVAVTGTQGQSVQTTIKAIAVKSGMQDSGVETFSYTIQITTPQPSKKGDVVKDDKGTGNYKVTDVTKKEVAYQIPAAKNATTVSIPATVKINGVTYKVTQIADNAFKNNSSKLKTVKIGTNVTSIGSNAFYGCSKLTSVTMGSKVTTISDKAFYKCTSLTKITIPSKVKKIGKQAFYGCKKLKSITIKTTKLTSKNVGSKAFKGIYSKATIKVPKSKLTSYKKILKAKGVSSKAKIKK